MFLTRCPACATTFRLTEAQLQARSGMVRCGSCGHPFNALLHLLDTDGALTLETTEQTASHASAPSTAAPATLSVAPEPVPEPVPEPEAAAPAPLLTPEALAPGRDPIDAALAGQPPLSPAELKQQGLEHGLLAARDLTEVPGFSRWAAAPLEGLTPLPAPRAQWPFVLASLILTVALLGQAAYHFRGELGRQSPTLAAVFAGLGIDLPPAREVERISIEASDLQAEREPGQLILLATLRNQAPYAQAWPALELSLTDTYDAVLIRRVFTPDEYLPADAPAAFPRGDTAIRLHLAAGELRPAGYRLYLFYP